MGSKHVKIGTWGGAGGDSKDCRGTPEQLIRIKITVGYNDECIRSISFYYSATDGNMYEEGPWGSSDGQERKVDLGYWNSLREISGTTGVAYGSYDVVKSLKFVTDTAIYGPYGRNEGTPFCISVLDDGRIDGFFGRAGTLLDAIGAYVNPN
uniref:Uncharacterized protein n=1 Tax=Avena sativa TaxID=4498 RepID=A0ACD5XT02_AVESA